MANKKRNREETVVDNVDTQKPLPGETFGLAITQPVPTTDTKIEVEQPYEFEPEPVEQFESEQGILDEDLPPPVVAESVKQAKPEDSIAATLLAVGLVYRDADVASRAISKWLPTIVGEPELHAFMHRTQTLLGEFHHAFGQLDENLSDRLRQAIQDAMMA